MSSTSDNASNFFPFGLLNPVQAQTEQALNAFSDHRVLENALIFEKALLDALADAQLIPSTDLTDSDDLFAPGRYSYDDLVAGARAGGNFAIPLVKQIKALTQQEKPELSGFIHHGTTSQDVIDTALVLTCKQLNSSLIIDLLDIEAVLQDLAKTHRSTVATARTLTQQSSPTTFGYRFAQWLELFTQLRHRLQDWNNAAPLQWSGASGVLAATVDEYGILPAVQIRSALAARLNLVATEMSWHTVGRPFTALVSIYGEISALFGAIAKNISFWNRTEIGEVREVLQPGEGSSSSMPHKANPVSTVLLNSLTLNFPALVGQLFAVSSFTDERPDGAWHAEWPILQTAGIQVMSITKTGLHLLRNIEVNISAVQKNLQLTHGRILSERIARALAAHLDESTIQGILAAPLPNVDSLHLLLTKHLNGLLSETEISELLEPKNYIGLAEHSVDEILKRYADSSPSPTES